jgi:hypothetical protein
MRIKKTRTACMILLLFSIAFASNAGRISFDLNGTWAFEQTLTAFPPETFTRSIIVPGLIHLAQPKIEAYDRYFPRPDSVAYNMEHNLLEAQYTPKYSWYKRRITIPKEKANMSPPSLSTGWRWAVPWPAIRRLIFR